MDRTTAMLGIPVVQGELSVGSHYLQNHILLIFKPFHNLRYYYNLNEIP